jgi:hypothetical protein
MPKFVAKRLISPGLVDMIRMESLLLFPSRRLRFPVHHFDLAKGADSCIISRWIYSYPKEKL